MNSVTIPAKPGPYLSTVLGFPLHFMKFVCEEKLLLWILQFDFKHFPLVYYSWTKNATAQAA